MSCSRTQHSDAGEARTSGPSRPICFCGEIKSSNLAPARSTETTSSRTYSLFLSSCSSLTSMPGKNQSTERIKSSTDTKSSRTCSLFLSSCSSLTLMPGKNQSTVSTASSTETKSSRAYSLFLSSCSSLTSMPEKKIKAL